MIYVQIYTRKLWLATFKIVECDFRCSNIHNIH